MRESLRINSSTLVTLGLEDQRAAARALADVGALDRLGEAGRHNDAALAIALRGGDSELEVRALGSRAKLRWWRGEVRVALHDWRSALAGAAMLSARDRTSRHSNRGAALYEIGQVEAGRTEIETARALFRRNGTPTQKSIAHAHLAELALVAALGGEADAACSHADRAASVYARCDVPLKVQRLAEAMSPHVAWRPVRRALT